MASIAPVNIDITARTSGLTKGIAETKARLTDLDRSARRFGRGAGDGYGASLAKVRKEAVATRQAVTQASASAGLLKTALKGVVAGATFGVGVLLHEAIDGVTGGLGTAVKQSVMLAAEAEKSQLAFEVMLGSADAAGRLIADLRRYSAESPFNSKDVSDAAKQLIAFGIEADQALPTIRALGDVASGVGVPLGQLVNAYGQVATAGRLMGTELLQFTQAGVPIIDALSKVMRKPKEDIKTLVEQGRVGFPVVVRAFKQMTEEGGKFAGMGDRYGRSMAGLFEQLQDAAELAMTAFGRVVIEETGLKDATRDLTAFTGRVREMADQTRPAVRFVGDLAKATAQVGNEFAKAGLQLGGIYLDAWVRAAPELRDVANAVGRIVSDAKSFEVNPVDVAELGIVLAEGAVGWVQIIRDGIVEIGDKWHDKLIKPMVDGAKSVKEVAEQTLEVIRQAQALKNSPQGAAGAVNAATGGALSNLLPGSAILNAALSGPNPPAGSPGHDPVRAVREEQLQRYARDLKNAPELDRAILTRNRDEMLRLWAEQDKKAGRPVMFQPQGPAAGSAGLQSQVIDAKPAATGLEHFEFHSGVYPACWK